MAEYGHGNHWKCITSLEDLMNGQLQDLVTKGQITDIVEVKGIFSDDGLLASKSTYSLLDSGDDLSALALIVVDKPEKTNRFVSGYPFTKTGTQLKLKIKEVLEWPNKYEAAIRAETEEGNGISFFDTKYFKNKEAYKVGNYYTFSLSALAYSARILEERTFSYEGQQAIDFLARTGDEPNYDENGNVKPVVFDLSDLVAYLPKNDPFPDDSEFQSPVQAIETTELFGRKFYKLHILLYRNPDIAIDLYVKEDLLEVPPVLHEPLRGVLWMQGYLAE